MIDFFPSLFLSESTKTVLNGTQSDIRNPWAVSSLVGDRNRVRREADGRGQKSCR